MPPGRKELSNFLPAVYYTLLCQALGGRILRSLVPNSTIGTSFSCSQITPYSNKNKDIQAAQKANSLLTTLFLVPLLGMGYPKEVVPILKRLKKYQKPEDAKKMCFRF
ncbi:family 1 glycosylhydrolase [uncultured Maribacter sp.]|uniref:family 1 glycosylhydrolase n=1 Tax=uncultured Maribacter sp. TaxID=431308 RepID=UPI0030DCFD11|tara:strand:- start:888 stop:1211 length:324 start_codon:yes stop_codon:yes gene_type:complete